MYQHLIQYNKRPLAAVVPGLSDWFLDWVFWGAIYFPEQKTTAPTDFSVSMILGPIWINPNPPKMAESDKDLSSVSKIHKHAALIYQT
jgi:hypothetical protein